MIQLQQEESERKVSIPTEKKSKNEMSKTGKVTVVSLIKYAHGHENPLIVIKNERYQHLGTVDFKEKLELGIESECKLRFSTHYLEARCTQCMVLPGDVIYLTHNQTIDCLEPIVLHAGEKSEQIDIIKKNIKNYDIFVHIRRWTLVVACLLCALYPLIDSGVFSSSSSSNNTTSTSFTSRLDVLHFIEGEAIYTPLGNLYISNGKAYDGSDSFVNDVIVDSYTANSAVIEIYPAQWSGYSMKFKVDKLTGDIYRIDK